MKELVTRDSLKVLLSDPDTQFVDDVIGHALWALFLRQTASEQSSVSSHTSNGRGFSEADARSGSITAKYYKKHGHLGRCSCRVNGDRHNQKTDRKIDNTESWRTARWTKDASNGYPKLCAYYVQLNEIANEKVGSTKFDSDDILNSPPDFDPDMDELKSETLAEFTPGLMTELLRLTDQLVDEAGVTVTFSSSPRT